MKKYDIPLSCNIFPKIGKGTCAFKAVDCGPPMELENGRVSFNHTGVGEEAHYSCKGEFSAEGSITTSTCKHSGQWSHTDVKCSQLQDSLSHQMLFDPKVVSLHLLIFLSMFSSIAVFINKHHVEISLYYYIRIQKYFKGKQLQASQLHKIYDAFVSYASSKETESFVMNTMTSELEKKSEAQLRLFLHHRDCSVGTLVTDNVLQALDRSKTAVILVNQDYIRKPWCVFEFAQCHLRMMQDPNFKIILVLMQPAHTLTNVPRTVRAYIKSTTYITKEDPKLWKRLCCDIVKK